MDKKISPLLRAVATAIARGSHKSSRMDGLTPAEKAERVQRFAEMMWEEWLDEGVEVLRELGRDDLRLELEAQLAGGFARDELGYEEPALAAFMTPEERVERGIDPRPAPDAFSEMRGKVYPRVTEAMQQFTTDLKATALVECTITEEETLRVLDAHQCGTDRPHLRPMHEPNPAIPVDRIKVRELNAHQRASFIPAGGEGFVVVERFNDAHLMSVTGPAELIQFVADAAWDFYPYPIRFMEA